MSIVDYSIFTKKMNISEKAVIKFQKLEITFTLFTSRNTQLFTTVTVGYIQIERVW